MFKTTDIEIIKYCQEQFYFDFQLPSKFIARQTEKFHSQIEGFFLLSAVVEHLMWNVLRKI